MVSSQGWRDSRRGREPRRRRLLHGALLTVVLALFAGFVYLVVAPFRHPSTHLLFATTGGDCEQGMASPTFALEQYVHLAPLREVLLPGDHGPASIPLLTPAQLDVMGPELATWVTRIDGGDTVVIYLAAHEIDGGKGAALRPGGAAASRQDIAIELLLQRIARLPGRTKLLVLDTTSSLVPGDGLVLPDSFPQQLAAAIARTGDPTLWVLTSHSPLEPTHTSAALRRTVFGYFVARGLKGDADLDRDHVISLGELAAYTRAGVADWVKRSTAGYSSQTPQLLWGGGAPTTRELAAAVVAAARLPAAERELDVQQSLAEAQEPRERGKWENVFRERVGNRLLPLTNPVRDKLTEARVPEIRSQLASATAAGSASQAPAAAAPASGSASGAANPPSDPAAAAGTSTPADTTAPAAATAAADSAGSEAATAASGTPAAGAAAEPGAAAAGTATSAPAGGDLPSDPRSEVQLLDQLAQAWLIHDQLLELPLGVPRPLDYAPDLWHVYQRQLLAVDQSVRAGLTFDTKPLARVLRDQLLPMQRLLQPSAATPSGSGDDKLADRFLARRPAVATCELVGSIAACVATGSLERRWNEAQRQALQRYQEILRSGSGGDFSQWLAQSWQEALAEVAELRGADELAELAAIDWPLAQRLLQVRWVAEEAAVAAAPRQAAHGKLLRADRLRRRGERLVRDRFGDHWQQQAQEQFAQAQALYADIRREAEAVERISRLSHDLLQSLPYWIALHRHVYEHPEHPFPTAEELTEALSAVAGAQAELASAQQGAIAGEATADRLQTLRDRLNRSVAAEQITRLTTGSLGLSDAWFIRLLLQTPLVPAQSRMRLLATVGEVEAVHLQAQAFDSIQQQARDSLRAAALPIDPARQTHLAGVRQQAANWARWQATLFALTDGPAVAGGSGAAPLIAESLRQRLSQQPQVQRSVEEFFGAYSELRHALARDSLQWSVRLIDILSQSADLSVPELRAARLDQLRRLQCAVRILGDGLGPPFEPQTLAERLLSAERYDLWAWLGERERAAMQGAAAAELPALAAAARDYQSLATRQSLQPPVAPLGAPTIEIQMPGELTFAPIDTTLTTNVTLVNRGGEAAEVWLVAATDPRYLQLQSPSGLTLYDEATLQDELQRRAAEADDRLLRLLSAAELGDSDSPDAEADADAEAEVREQAEPQAEQAVREQTARVARLRRAAIYPHQPEHAGLPPTLALQPGQSRRLPVVLQRTERAGRNTRWSLRAITASDHARQDAVVLLPDRSAVQLVVAGGDATWSHDDQGLTLHPYPNRATPYRIQLRNTRGHALTATVSVLVPRQPLRTAAPATVLPRAAAERWLDQIGTTTTVLPPTAMVLPADGSPVRLLPPEPSAEAPPIAPAEIAPASPAAGGEGAGGPPATVITSGFLVWVHDTATDTVAIETITISPQRPQRYTDVQLAYDAAIGQLQIQTEALHRGAIPDTGIPVKARLFDDAPRPLELTLAGNITADAPRLKLSADIPADAARTLTVQVDVDAFPRAFLFRLRPTDSQPSVPQWLERSGVRLLAPAPGAAFAAPVDAIEVLAEVDAPVGTFLDPRDELLIGIDVNRDRVFRNENPLVFRSDRQVEVRMHTDAATGWIDVLAMVSDYRIQVPGGELSDTRVNLLGYLRSGDRDTWSEPVEVILDGSPPRLGSVRVLPSRRVAEQTPLEISVSADDRGLSGVASVQVGVAAAGTNQLAAAPPPVEAVLTPGGSWAASFPTDELVPGTHRLLVQATDRVGNVSLPTPLSIDVLSEAEVMAERNQPKAINGRALHGNTAAAGATVELFTTDEEARLVATRTADAQGNFQFARVAPGEYRLAAQALVRNTRRRGELQITIPEGDRPFAPVRIALE